MNNDMMERIKFIVLIVLVITSMMQLGILWFFQNHEIPTNILQAFFQKPTTQKETQIKNYFLPYRIVASEGFDEAHFVLSPGRKDYQVLWDEVTSYIRDILIEGKPVSVVQYSTDEWAKLTGKESFIFEFNAPISTKIVRGFLNLTAVSNNEPLYFQRIIILPNDDVNNDIAVYIYDTAKIFKYKLKVHSSGLGRADYEALLEKLKGEPGSQKFGILKEIFPVSKKAPFQVRPDVPVALGDMRQMKFEHIIAKYPEFIVKEGTNTNEDISLGARLILGSDKESYDLGMDSKRTIIFKNISNIYRIYSDGWLEYQYLLAGEETGKGDELAAFRKALEFISYKKNCIGDPDIVFLGSSSEKDKNYYTFSFGYSYKGKLIQISRENNRFSQNEAIIIKSNGNKTIEAKWLMRRIEISSKQETEYAIAFDETISNIFVNNPQLEKKTFSIEDAYYGYNMDDFKDNQELNPSWIVVSKEGKVFKTALNKADER